MSHTRDCNGDRPSQALMFHNNGSSWWIQVTVDWSLPTQVLTLGYLKRRSFRPIAALRRYCGKITLSLIEQSQNSIMLRDRYQYPANFFIAVANQVYCNIAEDPGRVIYPTLGWVQCLPTLEARCNWTIEVVALTVSNVVFEQYIFAYKTTDRPIYKPEDTGYILNEIDILIQFCGLSSIAQLVGLIVSENLYKTCSSTDMPMVLIDFHSAIHFPPSSPINSKMTPDDRAFFAELKAFIRRHWQSYAENPGQIFDSILDWCVNKVGARKQSAGGHFQNAGLDIDDM
ncbi:hypothetical protein N7491_002149 [Penicillium cf. griseofulvum]|uniref:Uncharacterized protein n=1 Tax=Penicillium cf. griseofulvum TaxID=2972120 RepID=A0A9W9MTI1_9EURO|nr:hypothetical protein N7472_003669 [Penicillium cf. griseofulvum]KAJ5446067.1 hypothetical protein N7491_002149 [Penicillium cf. griseofulvum]KAJ5447807.1 hypothetical protein N7445_002628 [Penicillium cf. griseofulvum]